MGATAGTRTAKNRGLGKKMVQAAGPLLLVVALLSVVVLGGCAGVVSSSNPTNPDPASGAFQLSPSTVNFGSLGVGKQGSQTVTISNTGTTSVTIMQATVSNSQFTVSGMTLPMTMAASQSGTITIGVKPTATGTLSGTLTVQGDSNSGSEVVNLTATAVASNPKISVSSTSVNFGNVGVGSAGTSNFTISNTGAADLTISSVKANGTGFGFSGITTPKTIAAGQSSPVTLSFSPAAKGAASGSLSISSSDPASPTTTVTLNGTGVQAGLTVNPASFSYGNVLDGQTKSQTFTVTNSGTAGLTVSQLSVSGAGYTVNGLSLPANIAAGKSVTFNAVFAPTTTGSLPATVTITSNAPNSPMTVALSGTGTGTTQTLSFSPTNIGFGNVNTGASSTHGVTITNTGNANVQVSQIAVTGSGYSLTSASVPVTLSPSQTMTFNVVFSPGVTGIASGSVKVTSNATGSPATITLTGSGVQVVSHTVGLVWNPSTSTVSGYNVYRSTTSGGGYVKVNGSLISGLNYTDSNVTNGKTYFYVTTAVDSSGDESGFSNEASVLVQ